MTKVTVGNRGTTKVNEIVANVNVLKDGESVGTKKKINFQTGDNTTLEVSDDGSKINVKYNSSGGGGAGTVSSFSAGDLSPLFTSSVADPTTTPALTFAQVNQNANLIFAGPTTGAAAAPTFRSLVAADIPDLSGVYQPLLVSGTNIKTINSTSLLGSGDISITASSAFSSLTAATGTNTINNTSYAQEWQWDALGAGTGLTLSSSATDAASNTQTVFRVNQDGANASSTQTTYAGYFSNTKTGTASTNVGLFVSASGGTNNYAIQANGTIQQYDEAGANLNYFHVNGVTWRFRAANIMYIYSGANIVANFSNSGTIFNSGATQLMSIGPGVIIGPGTVTANTRLDIRGTGTGTNKTFRTATSANTETFYIQDNGAIVNNSQIGHLIGGTTITPDAILDIQSTTKAFIPPRMTEAQRDAIGTPSAGMVVYNTSTGKLNVYTSAWEAVTSA